jgi:hypothetical protein
MLFLAVALLVTVTFGRYVEVPFGSKPTPSPLIALRDGDTKLADLKASSSGGSTPASEPDVV